MLALLLNLPALQVAARVLLPLAALAARPARASCPVGAGWWVNGIRADGAFACLHTSVVESDDPADFELVGRLYCAPGEEPLVITERRVACRSRQGAAS